MGNKIKTHHIITQVSDALIESHTKEIQILPCQTNLRMQNREFVNLD